MAKTKIVTESIAEELLPDAPEEIYLDPPTEEQVTEEAPLAEEQVTEEVLPTEEEIQEAMTEHIRFLTRGWVPGAETPFVAPQQSKNIVEIIEPQFTCEDWISFHTDESKALMDGFKYAAKLNGWYYGTPSYWKEIFARWISSPA